MGDALAVRKRVHVRLIVHVSGVPSDAVVVWAGEGAKLLTAGMKPAQSEHASTPAADVYRTFDLVADGRRHWLRADVRSADGKLLLLGNPIYLTAK
jgi:hypothetical protein